MKTLFETGLMTLFENPLKWVSKTMLDCRSQPWLPRVGGRVGFFARCGGSTTGAGGAAGEGNWVPVGKCALGGGGAGEVHATHGGHDLACAPRSPAALDHLGEGTPALRVRASRATAEFQVWGGGCTPPEWRAPGQKTEKVPPNRPHPSQGLAARRAGQALGPHLLGQGAPLCRPPRIRGLRSQSAARPALFGEEPRPWAPPSTPARRRARRCPATAVRGQNRNSEGGFWKPTKVPFLNRFLPMKL